MNRTEPPSAEQAGRKRPREDVDRAPEPISGSCDVPESGSGSLGERVVAVPSGTPLVPQPAAGEEQAAPLATATVVPDSAEGPAAGEVAAAGTGAGTDAGTGAGTDVGAGGGPVPMLPMMMMMAAASMGMGMGMPFPGLSPPGGRSPFMPPAFMPALCQLLLVYLQRATQLHGQQQKQQQKQQQARPTSKPPASGQDTSPTAPGHGPAPESSEPPPAAATASATAPESAAATVTDATDTPASAPAAAAAPPPAVVAVSQLQEFGIPVPSLLQAAAHLMVVGALSPAQYQEVQVKLGPTAAQEGQGALATDGAVNAAATAVAAAAAAITPAAAATTVAAANATGAKAAAVLTPAAAAALAAAGGAGKVHAATSAPAAGSTFVGLGKAAPSAAGLSGRLEAAPRAPADAEPGLLPTVSWPGRGGVQAPFRLGLGRRLFCAVADQLPTNTELDCILPPMYGFSGVLYKIKDSAEVGAALWDGAVVRDLGPYTSAQDARQSVNMSIKLLAAAAAAAVPQPSGQAFTASGALPGAPSLRSGPSVRSGGVARRGGVPPATGSMRDAHAAGGGAGRGGGRGAKANGRSGLGAPEAGPGGAALAEGAGAEPAEADVLEAADQLLKLRSEGSGRINKSNSPEPLPVPGAAPPAVTGAAPGLLPPPALVDALVGTELGVPPLPPAVAAQLQALPGKQRSLAGPAAADDPLIMPPGGLPAVLAAAAPAGLGLQQLPDVAGGGKGSHNGSGSGRSGGAVVGDEPHGLAVTGRLATGPPGALSQARQAPAAPPLAPASALSRGLNPMHARSLAAAAAASALPESAGAPRAPTPSRTHEQDQQRRRDMAVVDLTMADSDVKSPPMRSPRGANGATPLSSSKPATASQVDSEAAALVALISSGRLQDMDRTELEALVAGSSGPALLAALQSLPQDLVAAATAAENGGAGAGRGGADGLAGRDGIAAGGGHEAMMEVDKAERGGQAGAAALLQRQQAAAVEQRRGRGWNDDGQQPAAKGPGSMGVLRLGRGEAGGSLAGDDGLQRGLLAGALAGDDGVLLLGGGSGLPSSAAAADGKDGFRGAAPRGPLHDVADEVGGAGTARRHHAADQEALLLQQLQELAGQAHRQAGGGPLARQRSLHQEPPMRGGGPGGAWAGPLQGRVGGAGALHGMARGGMDPRDEAMDAYASAVAAAVQHQQQHQHQRQQHHQQRNLHQQLQHHLAAGAGAVRGGRAMSEHPLSSGGLGGPHSGPGGVMGGGPRGGGGASPLLAGRRGNGDMLGLPMGVDGAGGAGGAAGPRYGAPLHGLAAAAAARGRFSPYDSPHHSDHQQQLSEPAEQLLQRLQAGRAAGALRLQQPAPGPSDGHRMAAAAAMYGRPQGPAGGGGGGGGASLSAHDGTGAYTTSGRTSSQPTYGASYSTHGSRGRDVSGGASAEAAFGEPSSGPYNLGLAGISSSSGGRSGGVGQLLGNGGPSGLPPAGGFGPADESPSGSGSGGLGGSRLGGTGELDAATGAEPTPKRQRNGAGVSREYSAVTNLVGLGLQEALAIVRQRQGPHV